MMNARKSPQKNEDLIFPNTNKNCDDLKQYKDCPKCHRNGIPMDAAFCPDCGTKL